MKYKKVFVYARCSSDGQTEGNSFDRQRERAQIFLSKANIPESLVEWIEDQAMSAFHGDHMTSGALGRLHRRVKEGGLSDGLLIFESVDRASRQGSMHLFVMLHDFLEAGFHIHFLDHDAPFGKENPPPFLYTFISIRAELARYESTRKSDMSADNWERRRSQAIADGTPITRECPMWLTVEDGRYVPIPDRVASVQTVFRWRRDGWGLLQIVREANGQRLPVPGKKDIWHVTTLKRLLKNRALIGEWQPYVGSKSRREAWGVAIENYYPAVLDKSDFYAAQSTAIKAEALPNRRDNGNYNYLMGLATCHCGGTWRRLNKHSGKQQGYAIYSCSNRILNKTKCLNINAKSFDLDFIGQACSKLPAMLETVDAGRVADETALKAELADAERRSGKWLDLLEDEENRDVMQTLMKRVRNADAEQKALRIALEAYAIDAAPKGGLSTNDALAVYIPAFLDYHQDLDSEAAKSAFRSRSIFRARVIQTIRSVKISRTRKTFGVVLTNGLSYVGTLDKHEFITVSDGEDEELTMNHITNRDVATRKLFRR